jgi:hypothetical protein
MRHRLALATLLCWSCGGSCSVAELIGFDGRAERDYARAPEQWQTAPVGSSFKMGDAVRTRDTSRAELKLSGGGTLKLGPSTAVRFVSEAPGGADVRVESGEAEIEAGGDAINVFTAAGRARVAERGRLKVERDANGQTRFSVVVGTAVIEDDEGPAALQSGASLLLPRRSPPSASPAPSPTEVPPPPVVETSTPAPALNVEAGGGITIHGHGVALELRFAEACPGEADVILRAKGGGELLRLRGKGSVRFSLPPLAERYEVVCEDGKIARFGALAQSADEGRKKASGGGKTVVTDGHAQVILHDEPSPTVRFRWPGAPASDAYSLVLARPGQKEPDRLAVEAPEYGARLPDGKYRVWFEVAESDQRSPTTEVEIRSDLSIAEVSEVVASGGGLQVSGVVSGKAKVSVDGAAATVDAQGRFVAALAPGPEGSPVVVRVDHPVRGVHVYARRRPGPVARSGP